jgi:hypothetical protein
MATLGFSIKWPKHMGGKETGFIPKIIKGLLDNNLMSENTIEQFICNTDIPITHPAIPEYPIVPELKLWIPKLHTIRADEKNLWVPGRKIHMVVFNRSKNRFQFAPVLEVKSVQKIEIFYKDEMIFLRINDRPIWGGEPERVAKNDGFDSSEHFFKWFNSDFKGKIIHWTDLKY